MTDKKYTDGLVLSSYFKISQSGNLCLTFKCHLVDGRTYYKDLPLIEKCNAGNVKTIEALTGQAIPFATVEALKEMEFGARAITLCEMVGDNGKKMEFINAKRGWTPRALQKETYQDSDVPF